MDEEQKNETKYFVFKANVPLKNSDAMLGWTQSCQAPVPEGHGDYRWGKILHDHLFVEKFKERLDSIEENQITILQLLGKVKLALEAKAEADTNSDLFK